MFLLTRPTGSEVGSFIEKARNTDLSYPDVGATSDGMVPAGYTLDHNRRVIGRGPRDLKQAADAVRGWKMFDTGWTFIHPPGKAIETGITVAIVIRHFGFWSMNAARIVYTIENKEDRFGFAYGTLAEHGEEGEERFMVEHDQATGNIWYDLLAFSKPKLFAAKLGYPFTRYLQKRFAVDSMEAMYRAVKNG